MDNSTPKIKRETKNKIRVDFERAPLWQRLKAKFLSTFFLKKVVFLIFKLVLLVGISYVILFPYISKIFGSFINDTSLVSCELPKSLGEINDQMFRSCISLRSLIIPENVTKIGQCAFYDCTGLEEINIPDSVVFIANSAFVNCDDLTVSCSSGSYAQEYCDKKGIRTNITGEASAERSGVDKDNSEMDNGEIRFYYYNDDLSEICLTKYYGKAKDIILEDKMDTDFEDNVKVSAIGQYFIDTDEDVTVYIPDSIITIDEYAFMYPERVTLKGSKGSYAEEYAKTYNMNFIAV